MPAASITATSAQAFVVPARAFGYEIKNVSDTTVYLRHAKTVATSGSTMGMPLEPGERRTFAFRHKLNHELTVMGIHGGSGSKSVVWDTLDQEVVAAGGVNSTANVTLSAGDVEIGAVELKDGTTDARAKVVAASTEAAAGDVALVVAPRPSEVVLGKTVGVSARPSSTPTFSVGGAAATGDYVGTTTTPQAFANAVRVSGSTGILKSITITDKLATAAVDMELWLFSATFTAPTDNAAWDISDTDQLNCVGVLELDAAKWYASASGKTFCNDQFGLLIGCAATSLFYALVARGTTPAWATGDLQITLGILQD